VHTPLSTEPAPVVSTVAVSNDLDGGEVLNSASVCYTAVALPVASVEHCGVSRRQPSPPVLGRDLVVAAQVLASDVRRVDRMSQLVSCST
jgi:hypothetical protein